MARGTPFALSHHFFQTGPFRPNNVTSRGCRAWCSSAPAPCPAWACPWCCCRAGWPPTGSSELAPAMTTLEESYARCRQLNRRYGTTYYWSTYLLPAVKRHHVHALYGFCRYADDIVDDLGRRRRRRAGARRSTDFGDRFFVDLAAGRSDDPVLKAVVHTVQAFDIDPGASAGSCASMAMDFTVETYETFDDLLDYMDGSAAVIGEMMLPILEPTSAEAFEPARDLGIAFQLSNFLRDVNEDLDRGRVYLPQEDLRKFGADPWRRVADEPWRDLMAFEIARTREWYASPTSASPCCRRRRPAASAAPAACTRDPRPDRGRRLRRVLAALPGADVAEARRRRHASDRGQRCAGRQLPESSDQLWRGTRRWRRGGRRGRRRRPAAGRRPSRPGRRARASGRAAPRTGSATRVERCSTLWNSEPASSVRGVAGADGADPERPAGAVGGATEHALVQPVDVALGRAAAEGERLVGAEQGGGEVGDRRAGGEAAAPVGEAAGVGRARRGRARTAASTVRPSHSGERAIAVVNSPRGMPARRAGRPRTTRPPSSGARPRKSLVHGVDEAAERRRSDGTAAAAPAAPHRRRRPGRP